MKTRSVFVVALFCVFTIGCNGENRSFEKVIPTPSSMPALTLTSNFTPTPLLTTPQGSAFSPSPISSMTMPQWVTDPKVQILFVPTGTFKEGYKNLTLVNAMTSERFDLQLSADSGDYFWLPDGLHAGMLSRDMPQITLVSMIDGQITSISVPESITRFAAQNLSGPPYPLQASSLHPKDPNFMLLPSWMQLSPDRKYFIYQENYDPKYTSVFEISTNQTIVMTDPNDKYFDLFSEWSPDSRYLAVSQADQEPGMLYHFDSPPTFRLRVYDMNTHQMVASYKDVTFPSWSPDGLKFLFQEWRDWFGESPPCLFDTISGTTKCYYDELIRHKKSNTSQTTFSSIQWSPDQTMIGYIYSNVDQAPYAEYGGFCVITLASNNSRCMLEKFELDGQKIIDYSWSPDSNFISFQYDTSCPYCDYSDSPQLAIADVKTGKYFPIGDNVNGFQLGLWRPPLKP